MKKNKYAFFVILSFFFLCVVSGISQAQVELVPASNKIYDFLDRMLVNGIISNYSSSIAPISRREIAGLLEEINNKKTKISKTDKNFLEEYLVEYEYDLNHTLKNSSLFF